MGGTKHSVGSVAFGIGRRACLLEQYPGTRTFRALLKKNFDAYREANQEGRDEIAQDIVDQFPPDAFFKLEDGELSPLDKQLAKMEVKTSMARLRGHKTSKEKENKMRTEEPEESEGIPSVNDLLFRNKMPMSAKNRGTLRFEKMVMLILAQLRNKGGKIYLNASDEKARGLARRLLKQQKEVNPGQAYFEYDAITKKYCKQTDEQAFWRAVNFVESVKRSHNSKQMPIEKRCRDYGMNLNKEDMQDANNAPTMSDSAVTNSVHEITKAIDATTLPSCTVFAHAASFKNSMVKNGSPFRASTKTSANDCGVGYKTNQCSIATTAVTNAPQGSTKEELLAREADENGGVALSAFAATSETGNKTLQEGNRINAARRGTKRPFDETNAVYLDETDDSIALPIPLRDRVGPLDQKMLKHLLEICESDPNFKHVVLSQLCPELTNFEQSGSGLKRATRNPEKQLKATISENERLQKSNEMIEKDNDEKARKIAALEAQLVYSKRREEELKVSGMEELKSALSLRTNLEKSLAESRRATQNAEKQLEATMSENERLKRNEQRIAELEAKLDSIKEDHQTALSRNRRLRTNNGALRTSNEQNKRTISGLEAKIGREKDLEEISKRYEDAYKSMAEKNGVLEDQLQAVKDWFENEARLGQQLEDQIEAILAP
ncbi:unnamed protein product [Cylindrotheca closterium]|uniref:Uncharacterized protein n=1 Tax=Cylindrotheca closterium TaxID=2856 RepID=A0AAD2PW11_9STRA|nr:unnamed protein product [Cylindrotheca closterium]